MTHNSKVFFLVIMAGHVKAGIFIIPYPKNNLGQMEY
jgi:hypothetical protein